MNKQSILRTLALSLLVIGFGLVALPAQGQSATAGSEVNPDESRFLHSVGAELQLGYGGGPLGIMVQADRVWGFRKKLFYYSSLSFSSFTASEAYDESPVRITGFSTDNHLRLHFGGGVRFLKSMRLRLRLDVYGGMFHYWTRGRYFQSALGIERDYRVSRLIMDWGTRLQLGYNINQKWGVQLSLTNSWKQAAFGLGVPVGLLAGQPDGKASFGFGIRYRWGQ